MALWLVLYIISSKRWSWSSIYVQFILTETSGSLKIWKKKKNGKGQDIKYGEGPLAEGATARNPHIFQKEHRNATAVLENNDSQ